MYATLVLEFSMNPEGAPAVRIETLLKAILPDVQYAVMTQEPLGGNMVTPDGPKVNWKLDLHAEIGV